MGYPITTQKALRAAFFAYYPDFRKIPGRRQNRYPVDVRMAWVDFVDAMSRDYQISASLASRVIL